MSLHSRNPHRAYQSDQILTLSPVGLVVRMLGGAVSAIDKARRHLDAGRTTECRSEVNRARAIVSELRGAVDRQAGGEIAGQLDQLYDFIVAGFLAAGGMPSAAMLADAARILGRIKEGFDVVLMNQESAAPTLR